MGLKVMRKRRSKKIKNSNRKTRKRSKKSKRSKQKVKRGGMINDGNKPSCGGKRSKKSKKTSNNGSSNERLNDPNLKALCMRCFHSSGKKTKSCGMKLNNRTHDLTSRGLSMIRGRCSKCDGKMVVFV
jgi:hypothetical protein